MTKLKHGLMLGAAAVAVAVTAGAARAAEEKVLNIYNWSDYIAEDTLKNFETRTGIKVNYDVFDSNEILEAKLLAGNSGYDIVVPTASFLERQVKAGVFRKLDRGKLTNWGNLDSGIMKRLEVHDPNNAHSVPYMWGTTGIGYNVGKVTEILGEDAPTDSWALLFDPEVTAKLATCGITLLNAASEVFNIAFAYLGRDPHSERKEDLDKAEELFLKIRPHIKYFHSSQYIDDLANGEICVALGWSGDVFQAMDDAADGVEIGYTIPKEGTVIWFDLMAIPADAPHPENAHRFINYILEPEVVAQITNEMWYANPNAASTKLVNAEIRNDPAIYPSPEVQARLFADKANSQRFTRLMTRAWTRIKTGQ